MTTTNQTNQIFTPRQLGRGESEKSTLNFLTNLPLNKLFLTFLIHPSSPAMLRYDRYCLRRLSAPSLTLEVRQKWDRKWRCNALISAAVYTPPSSGGMSDIRGRRGGDNCDKTPQRFNLTKWRGAGGELGRFETDTRKAPYRCIWEWNEEMELRQMVAEREQRELRRFLVIVHSECVAGCARTHTQIHTEFDRWGSVPSTLCSFHTLTVTQQEWSANLQLLVHITTRDLLEGGGISSCFNPHF